MKNQLNFSGKIQLVFVLRRKKTAKFVLVLKQTSFFRVLPLTQRNLSKIPFRPVFFAKKLEYFRWMSKKSRQDEYFFEKLVFPQNVTLVAPNATLEIWPEIFPEKSSKSITKNRNWQNNPGVLRDKKSLQMFFWTFRKQFTQCCGKTLVKIMKKFRSESKTFETCSILSRLITAKRFSELKKMQF